MNIFGATSGVEHFIFSPFVTLQLRFSANSDHEKLITGTKKVNIDGKRAKEAGSQCTLNMPICCPTNSETLKALRFQHSFPGIFIAPYILCRTP